VDEQAREQRRGLITRVVSSPIKLIAYPPTKLWDVMTSDLGEALLHAQEKKVDVTDELKEAKRALEEIENLLRPSESADPSTETQPVEKKEEHTSQKRADDVSKREARKKIKAVEKQINAQYRILDDAEHKRYELSKQLLKSLDDDRKDRHNILLRGLYIVGKPFQLMGRGVSSFLFGLSESGDVAQDKAEKRLMPTKDRADKSITLMNERIKLEEEKIILAKENLELLYDQLERLQTTRRGLFRSILIFPKNLFTGDRKDGESYDIKKLRRHKEEYEVTVVALTEELEKLDSDIAQIGERQREEQAKQAAKDAEKAAKNKEAKERVVYKETVRMLSRKQRVQYKDFADEVEDIVDAHTKVIDAENELFQERVKRFNKLLKDKEDIATANTDLIVASRKETFRAMDDLRVIHDNLTEFLTEVESYSKYF